MATLTGKQIKDSYDGLLKLDDNAELTSAKKTVTDGLGNATPLSISDTEVKSTVDLEASGFKTPTGTANDFLLANGTTTTIRQDKEYVFKQVTATNIWNVYHGLNKRPSVTVVDSAGSVVVGEVSYVDANNVTLTFSAPFKGDAYFN